MVVQVLVREMPAGRCDGCRAGDIAIHQEGHVIGILGKGLQDEITTGNHFTIVVCRDVGGKQLGLPTIVLRTAHCIGDGRNGFFQRRKNLVSLRFIVLDEITAHPEVVCRLCKRLWPQAELGLDDGADNEATVNHRAFQYAPQV